jgi:hypothetical protein
MRGIQLTLSGEVKKKQDGGKEVLVLSGTSTRPDVTLAPFQKSSQIEWDKDTGTAKPVTDKELGAYAALSSAIGGNTAAKVEVTGTIHKQGEKKFVLDVRRFEMGGAKTS